MGIPDIRQLRRNSAQHTWLPNGKPQKYGTISFSSFLGTSKLHIYR